MSKEIRVVHDINLGDLARFEKALKAVTKTGDIAKTTAELEKQVKAQDKKNSLLKEEKGIVGGLLSKQKDLRAAQKYATTEKELKKINKELRRTQKELTKAKDTTSTWSKALGSFQFKFNALGNIAANVASTIARKFNMVLREAVKTVVEFEAAMAGVRAISGATGEEFKKLSGEAIRLGGATIFTARQVAELQINYAKLGFSVDEIVNVTEATLALAAATDEGLAASALIAGSSLRAFGYDAIQMQRVIDVMAQSFTSSALTLSLWGESMKFAGSIMRSAGLDIEQSASALQILADRSIKGSIAGNAMKNILLRMVDANSALSKETGFVVKNNEDFIRTLEILKEKNIDLTKVLEFSDKRSVNALNILIQNTKALKENKEAADNARGSTQEMAEIRMDTLAGSITILKSAWEGLILSAEQGTNALTVGVRSFIDSITESVVGLKRLMFTLGELAEQDAISQAREDVEAYMISIKNASLENQLDAARHRKVYFEALTDIKTAYDELFKDGELNWNKMTRAEREQNEAIIFNYKLHEKKIELYDIEIKKIQQRQNEQQASLDREEQVLLSFLKLQVKRRKQYLDAVADYEYQVEVTRIRRLDLTIEDETKMIANAANAQFILKKESQIAWLREMAILVPEETKIYEKQIEALRQSILNRGLSSEVESSEQLRALGLPSTDVIKKEYAKLNNEVLQLHDMGGVQAKNNYLWAIMQPDSSEAKQFFALSKQATDFVVKQLDEVNDNEIRLLNMQVDRMNTHISELQRSLDQQYDLQKEGKANRVNLIEQEIKEEQAKREQAYREQEKLERRKRAMQSLTQAANVATALTNIWVAETPKGTAGVILAIAGTAAMLASLAYSISQIDKTLPKYAEGGWIDGKPHSQGGTMMEAEKGEFVVRKDRASVFGDILESLNGDSMTQAWDTINGVRRKGNTINILTNSKTTDKLLEELVTLSKEAPKDFGDHIEFYYKGTKYRIKK